MKKSELNQNELKKKEFSKTNHQKNSNWVGENKWRLILFFASVTICIGYIGFKEYFELNYEQLSFFDLLYRTFQLFVLDSGAVEPPLNFKLELARWIAPIISTIIAANALIVLFNEQLQLFKIRFLRGHIIICGLGNKGLLLAQKFKKSRKKVVVIEIDEENDNIKECRDIGAIVLIGNAMAPYILHRAGLKKAKYLIPVCGEDGINAGIAVQARELVGKKRKKPLTCIVHIVDPQLCRLIKEKEFDPKKNKAFRLEFLNLFDQAAETLLKEHPPFGEKKEIQSPHILIVGAGGVGERLLIYTAKKWMDLPGGTDEKIKISIIDNAAKQKVALFHLRYPGLDKVCNTIPLEMDIKSSEFESGRFLFNSNGECDLTIIYICIDNESFALSIALTLHHRIRNHNIHIIARMNSEAGLAGLIQGGSHGTARLYGFGLLDRVLEPEPLLLGTHEVLARVIHEEYRRYQTEKEDTPETNPALVPWEKLPETLKDSNRRQADYLGVKLREIGCYIVPMIDWNAEPVKFTPDEIELMAKMEHNDWVEERQQDGWKYAPGPKDIKRKKSPFLVPWEELPEEEKEKDRNPVRQMPNFLAKAGFQIYRIEHKTT